MTPRPIMAILDGISTRKDGTLKVTLETNELHTEDSVYLMQNVNKRDISTSKRHHLRR